MSTTFSYPLQVKRITLATSADDFTAKTVIAKQATINTTKTGTAAGTTTIPLFVAPAGSRIINAFLDITTAYDNDETKVAVGTAANAGQVFAATTVNTAGRQSYAASAAQVSANAIAFTADTTIQAVVSITTSAVTAGSAVLTVFII